jgi:hypothetical protein
MKPNKSTHKNNKNDPETCYTVSAHFRVNYSLFILSLSQLVPKFKDHSHYIGVGPCRTNTSIVFHHSYMFWHICAILREFIHQI